MLIVIEKRDKREEYLAKLWEDAGYTVRELGDNFATEEKKVYIMSISSLIREEQANKIPQDSIVFARDASEEIQKIFAKKNITYHNYNADEDFLKKNAYITAEGTLLYIIDNTDTALIHQKALVLGYGRVGKAMCQVLKNNGVYTAVATDVDMEQKSSTTVVDKSYNLKDYIKDITRYDVIINTIPALILKGETLNLIDKECFIIDLASAPGGVDYEAAKRTHKKVMHALGVPAKTAPKTAATYLKESITKSLMIR